MKIEPQAFLAIEKTMAAAMHAEWNRIASGVIASIHTALVAKDYAAAQMLANSLTMEGVVNEVRPRLEELATSAVLFGAHRASGSARNTIYAKGDPLPVGIGSALALLEHNIEQDAAEVIRKAVHGVIDELKRQDATAHFQKYNPDEPRDCDGDVSVTHLTASGGIQEPEQAELPEEA